MWENVVRILQLKPFPLHVPIFTQHVPLFCWLARAGVFKAFPRFLRETNTTRIEPQTPEYGSNTLTPTSVTYTSPLNVSIPDFHLILPALLCFVGEKSARKKQLCVKMLARNMCADAINSLVFLSKQKRPPAGYCLVG